MQSKEELLILLNSANEGIWVLDPEGKITFANNACVRLFGFEDKMELLGKNAHELVHHKHADGSHYFVEDCPIYKALNNKCELKLHKEVFWRADGTPFHADVTASPLTVNGQFQGLCFVYRDIDDLVHAQESIALNNRKIEILSDLIPGSAWSATPEGSHTHINQRFASYLGLSGDKIIEELWAKIIHVDDLQATKKIWTESIIHGKDFKHQIRIKRHDGEYRWHLTKASPVKDKKNKIINWLGSNTDIHDQIMEKNEMIDVLESMSDSFFSVDKNWIIQQVNSHHERISNLPRELQVGKNFLDLFLFTAELKQSKYWTAYNKAMHERVQITFEDYYKPLKIWTQVRIYPKTDGGLAVFFSDISSEKNISDKLEQNEQRLRIATESAKIGTFYFDCIEQVFTFSDISCTIFNWPGTSKNASLEKFMTSIHPEDQLSFNTEILKLMNSKSSENMSKDFKILWQNGEIRHVFMTAKSLYETTTSDRKVISFMGVCMDITDRVNLQNELKEAKSKADQASLSKSAFLANMSHEIRTPLGVVLGFSELLKNENLPQSSRQRYIEAILRNGKSLVRIIDDILDLAKVEEGKLIIEEYEFSLFELIQECIDSFEDQLSRKKLSLNFYYDKNLAQLITSDPTRLRQILINIIGNAIKFTQQGSISIEVNSQLNEKGHTTDLHQFKILIQDTGIGLSQEQQQKLFQPFTQADTTITRQFGGTGLGLALSRRMAQALGGSVSIVNSEPDCGSLFAITFQAKITKIEQSQIATAEDLNTHSEFKLKGQLNVLIVDDSEDNRTLITEILENKGLNVDLAEDGNVAVHKAMNSFYDVILMDLQMPHMDGYHAIKNLHAHNNKTPIIALTAHAMLDERKKTQSHGFAGLLTKPINENELLKLIQTVSSDRI